MQSNTDWGEAVQCMCTRDKCLNCIPEKDVWLNDAIDMIYNSLSRLDV